MKDLWDKSVDVYHAYAQRKDTQYWQTSRTLVELAQVKPGHVVVDLAAGTGVTTKCLLEMEPEVSQVYAVDRSQPMLDRAKEYVQHERVTYVCAGAEDLALAVPPLVDRVLCNSAFWHFPNRGAVLTAIHSVLQPDGLFAFNLPHNFIDVGGVSHRSRFVREMFIEMEKRGLAQKRTLTPPIAQADLIAQLTDAGLRIVTEHRAEFPSKDVRDSADFFKIPAVAPFFDGVPDTVRDEILETVAERLEQEGYEVPYNTWMFFVAQK